LEAFFILDSSSHDNRFTQADMARHDLLDYIVVFSTSRWG